MNIKKCLILFITILAMGGIINAENKEQSAAKKEVCLQLYSLRDDISKDYEGTIRKAGQMGYTSIEAAGYDNGKFYGRTPSQFKADIETAGMKVLSSHTVRQLSEQEVKSGNYSESLQWWDQAIKAHKEAGMKYIVMPWMDTPATLKDLQTYCDYFNEVGKKCKANGMAFGYHNHDHEFNQVEGKVMMDYLIENTNPEYVFIELDVYWAVMARQSPVDYFNKYKNRFTLLHLKDDKELGQSGMIGFDAIFRNSDAAGVKHMVVEVEQYNLPPLQSVKESLDYLIDCKLFKTSYSR